MADPLPTRDDVRQGTTVTVVQEQDENPGEPLVGEVRTVRTEEHTHPEGIEVELESGVVGRVKAIGEADPDEIPKG